MKKQKTIMAMPVIVEIVDDNINEEIFEKVFDYLISVDEKFSPYKVTSEVSKLNRGEIFEKNFSAELSEVLKLAEETKTDTDGYFDIYHKGICDPSGLVKGYAIWKASQIIREAGYKNFYLEIAGDIEVGGLNNDGEKWKIGIKNPFKQDEIISVVHLTNCGIATSGTYMQGEHIYNPKENSSQKEIVSLTIIGPNVYEADRFATACFAMGEGGIYFVESKKDLAGMAIDKNGIATYTNNYKEYLN